MKIHFWGAAQTVTGSAHYLEINGRKLLLDCGLFQGRRKDTYTINRQFPYPPNEIDAVILSHAHIDHSGNLPNLVKNGYDKPIYAQNATVHLAELMLRDSGSIQESDAIFVNKKRAKRGEAPIEPLYTEHDAEQASNLLVMKAFQQTFEPIPGVTAHFVEAGHILGSASIILDIEEQGAKHRLWFSGDIGRPNLPILNDPVLPYEAGVDYMIMESTYGDRPHRSPQEAHDRLQRIINQTLQRGGKVLIPAFAVGRTQELVYAIHRMMDAGDIPTVPVYVDSPLAVSVTEVFQKHRELFDEEALAMIDNDKHRAALGFDTLTYIRDVKDSIALNDRTDPMIIISTSGMMEAGRILHHLRHNIHDPNSTILLVSWQAPHTLGRRLLEGQERVKIYGEVFERKIQAEPVAGFSAHAGQTLLKEYALAVKGQAKELFLVHGDPECAAVLQDLLRADGMESHYPERGWLFET